jgi:hypothetical protein
MDNPRTMIHGARCAKAIGDEAGKDFRGATDGEGLTGRERATMFHQCPATMTLIQSDKIFQ